ncbi:glycosyl hydrolase, partial [Crocinitomicaceae bacterium]|nr:glycosyl hydrolase [Crocinitomicaceae bacterium]
MATASGGVWKTTNHGTTFSPIFDSYGSYSIGCVTIAPTNSNTVWIGTGENNNQRAVAYGDGVYKSLDGGKSFKNMGLKTSEHIGKIIVHPTNENIVWVAAYGPLWSKGGERGVYKTTDGGTTWKLTLEISEHTGIAEIAIDPTNPDILYASAHQRRRREWTYIGGGPESGLHKSTDGGITWKANNSGLPEGNMGRIGIAVSPVDENYIYAIIEARNEKGGFFRSTNKGESWSKMSSYKTSGNYYQEIICDLKNKDKVFSMSTRLHHTIDGGKTFVRTGEKYKHVDNHCIWIDPKDENHWIVGCDGGIYETYNHAKDWNYFNNLPVTQFYKVATDNDAPFYNIYGGTQDNWSLGGPSGTLNNTGIVNSDWFVTNGGDGFESAIDPTDPNIAYAQSQYGGLIRFDKASGERVSIKPMPGRDELAYRWNWDSPLLISPHDHKTLYFCANKVFKSTNRGNDWQTVSPDLSQQIDRNKLPVMDQVWSIDAVMKNMSTTIYGNIVAFDESPLKQGLLYAGTDDGLIQTSKDAGGTWSSVKSFSGIPENTRVNMIVASLYDENTVFAVFNNHRSGDFKPYLMKSTNQGKSWTSIVGNLPERGSVFAFRQDHVDPKLLFAGTEFGCYFSNDGGLKWTKLNGLPTIAVYDIELQKRENDIVIATFGRGFYVMDDYSPLRSLSKDVLAKDAYLFPIKDADLFVYANPIGGRENSSQGASMYRADNPKFGATFSLYLKGGDKSLKSVRQKEANKLEKEKEAVPYPSFDELREEEMEGKLKLIWVIKDSESIEIKRISSSPSKGLSRVTWNLRTTSTDQVGVKNFGEAKSYGFLVIPGEYSVEIFSEKDGIIKEVIANTKFNVVGLNNQTLLASNNEELKAFRKEMAEVRRSVSGAENLMKETGEKLKIVENAVRNYPGADLNLLKDVEKIKNLLLLCDLIMNGDKLKAKHQVEDTPSISD